MRKLLTIFFLFFSLLGVAQTFPTNQWFGSATTLTEMRGAMKAGVGIILTRYSDTATANLNPYIKNYAGSQIVIGDTIWFRNSTASKWLKASGAAGSGGGTLTDFIFTDGNGVNGIVTNSTTTPTLSLEFTPVGILKSNGTSLSAAIVGTDYVTSNIYSADDVLASNRIVGLNGKTLDFTEGGNSFLSINPTAGAETIVLQAYNTTGNDNSSFFSASTTNTNASFNIVANFNSGVKSVDITALSNTTTSSIDITADSIRFIHNNFITDTSVNYVQTINKFTGTIGKAFFPSGGAVGNTIYTGDGTLAGDRTVNLDGHNLEFVHNGNYWLHIGAEDNNTELRSYNTTITDNLAFHQALAGDDFADSEFGVIFDQMGVDIEAQIIAHAEAAGSSIDYDAETHQFTGNVGIGVAPTALFEVSNGVNTFLSIEPTAGAETVDLQAFNTTGSDNQARFNAATTNTSGQFFFQASFNGEATNAQITGDAVSGSSSLAYEADTHTFTGHLLTQANNTYDIGDATNAFKDIYGRTLKLDGSTSGTITLASDALSNTIHGTTLSGLGVIDSRSFARPTGDFTLANSTSDQVAFGTTIDVWTLQANTSYYFEGEYYLTHGAVSHALSMGFTLAGGATITSINYSTQLMTGAVNTVATAQSTVYIIQTASTAVNLAGANATEYVKFSGWINVADGGTFSPHIKFSVDPTGTCLMKAGSYIMFTPMGTNTVESIGPVN